MPVDDEDSPEDLAADLECERHRGKRLADEGWYGLGGGVESATEAQIATWATIIRLRADLRRRALNGDGSARDDLKRVDKTIHDTVQKSRTKLALDGLINGTIERDRLRSCLFEVETLLETMRGQEVAVQAALSTTTTKAAKRKSGSAALPLALSEHRAQLERKYPGHGVEFDREVMAFSFELNAKDIDGLAALLEVETKLLRSGIASSNVQRKLSEKGPREAAYEVLEFVGYSATATTLRRLRGVDRI